MALSMPDKKDSMELLKGLLETEKLTPVIDSTYPLAEVPEAIRYLEEGYARGKVVITVREAGGSAGGRWFLRRCHAPLRPHASR